MGIRSRSWEYAARWCLAALMAVLLMAPVLEAAAPDRPVSLELTQGTLGAALEDLARQTGYQFELDPQWANRPVTLKARGISLRECLQRILEPFNYALVFGAQGRVAIDIYGEQSAVTSRRGLPAPVRAPAPVVAPDISPDDLDEDLEDELGDELDEDELADEDDELDEEAEDESADDDDVEAPDPESEAESEEDGGDETDDAPDADAGEEADEESGEGAEEETG